jgi:hypothetical protein
MANLAARNAIGRNVDRLRPKHSEFNLRRSLLGKLRNLREDCGPGIR